MKNKQITLREKIKKCHDKLERLTNLNAMFDVDFITFEIFDKVDVIGFHANLAQCALDNNDTSTANEAIKTIIMATKELSSTEHYITLIDDE